MEEAIEVEVIVESLSSEVEAMVMIDSEGRVIIMTNEVRCIDALIFAVNVLNAAVEA